MTEVETLKKELVDKNVFIQNLIEELSEAYMSIELIKDEVVSITQDFKHLIEALKK